MAEDQESQPFWWTQPTKMKSKMKTPTQIITVHSRTAVIIRWNWMKMRISFRNRLVDKIILKIKWDQAWSTAKCRYLTQRKSLHPFSQEWANMDNSVVEWVLPTQDKEFQAKWNHMILLQLTNKNNNKWQVGHKINIKMTSSIKCSTIKACRAHQKYK